MTDILKDARRNTTIEDKKRHGNISSNDGATNSLLTSNDGKDYFSILPEEIILMIFKFLPPRDIMKPVCKRWYDVSFNSILWKNVSLKCEFISIKCLKNILSRGIRILCCEKCTFVVPIDWSSFGKDRFDNLQTLSLEYTIIDGKAFENLLSLTPHLKVLNLRGHRLINYDSSRQMSKLKKLEHLEIQSSLIFFREDFEPSECTNGFCSLRFLILKCCLRQRTIRSLLMCCSQLIHLSLFDFTLDLLDEDIELILKMENLEHLEIGCDAFQTAGLTPSYHKRLHKLRYLEISCEDESIITIFLSLCENLMELHLTNVLMDNVPSSIAQMKELHTLRIENSDKMTPSQIQNILRGCPKLREHNLLECSM